MSYRVLARKYRPQRFEEVVGQEPIIRTLQNAIKSNRIAQAYLFVGPRGVGKTSTARIFAKALNCEHGPTPTPCGKCDTCLEIAEGRNLDVLEIDGASNNSVESIRTLRDNAAFAPARGPFKIYLIDEVHMLTTAAFNALLKTLEEPPEHVKFLFATTEAQKLPATITSRCQRFDLHRLSEEQIAQHLLWIAEEEEVGLDPGAAATIARGAEGALRDAESMLDQVISFCGDKIEEKEVQHIFGFTSQEVLLQSLQALLQRDLQQLFTLVTQQYEEGRDLGRFLTDLTFLLHQVVMELFQKKEVGGIDPALLTTVSSTQLIRLLELLGEGETQMRWATQKKLQLETLLIKGVHLLEQVTLDDVLGALHQVASGEPLPSPEKVASLLPFASTPVSYKAVLVSPQKGIEKEVQEEFQRESQVVSSWEQQEQLEDNLKQQKEVVQKTPQEEKKEVAQLVDLEEVQKCEKTSKAIKSSAGISDLGLFQQEWGLASALSSKEIRQNDQHDQDYLNKQDSGFLESSSHEGIEVDTAPQEVETVLEREVEESNSSSGAGAWKEVARLLAQESSLKFGWLAFGEFVAEQGRQFQVEFHPSFQHRTETLFWSQVRKKVQEFLQEKMQRSLEFVPQFGGTSLPSEESLLAQELAQEPEITSLPPSSTTSPAPESRERLERKQEKSSHLEKNTPNSGSKGVKEESSETTALTPEELEAFKKDPLIQEALKIFEAEIIT